MKRSKRIPSSTARGQWLSCASPRCQAKVSKFPETRGFLQSLGRASLATKHSTSSPGGPLPAGQGGLGGETRQL